MVSVIIPTYGGAENLCRAIDSLLAQTYRDLEILVVDDNGLGTPRQLATADLLQPYLARPGFRYIPLERNMGGSYARNRGAEQAKGEYLMFLDDDDAVSEDKIEKQVLAVEKAPQRCAVSYCSSKIFVAGSLSNVIKAKKNGDLLYDYLMSKVYMGTGTMLMKSTVWQELGGYDESFVRHQDLEFFARILNRYEAVAVEDAYFLRHITDRNLPSDRHKAQAYADHYMAFLQTYPFRLTDRRKRRIINRNNSRVALRYLMARDLSGFAKTLCKYDNFAAAFCAFAAFTAGVCLDKLLGRKS